MSAFYNENDPKAAAWLRELIQEGHIAPGVVDERSITEINADELYEFSQCHFFAGIGGWSLALRLAGVPDAVPVWTGSCPCQPFSAAGKRRGAKDERHLWPVFRGLIEARRPGLLFGEQVASAAVFGKAARGSGRRLGKKAAPVWLDGVFNDLERARYACGAADLPAACVGAPHIRQRAWWVAYSIDGGLEDGWAKDNGEDSHLSIERSSDSDDVPAAAKLRSIGRLADALQSGRAEGRARAGDGSAAGCGGAGRMADAQCAAGRSGAILGSDAFAKASEREEGAVGAGKRGAPGGVDDAERAGLSRQPLAVLGTGGQGYWSAFDVIPCLDGKARRIEPGSFPLAHGVPGRVGLLRGYGNAIVPELAAQFIAASIEALMEVNG